MNTLNFLVHVGGQFPFEFVVSARAIAWSGDSQTFPMDTRHWNQIPVSLQKRRFDREQIIEGDRTLVMQYPIISLMEVPDKALCFESTMLGVSFMTRLIEPADAVRVPLVTLNSDAVVTRNKEAIAYLHGRPMSFNLWTEVPKTSSIPLQIYDTIGFTSLVGLVGHKLQPLTVSTL